MNKEVNEMILQALREQDSPVERRDLLIFSGVLEIEEFNNAISYLERKGKIILDRKKVGLPENMGCIAATIVRQARGFSFASPEREDMEDIFIHEKHLKGAMPGDVVMLKKITAGAKGFSGEVDKILEKGTRVITGTIERPNGKAGKAYIIPDNMYSCHLAMR